VFVCVCVCRQDGEMKDGGELGILIKQVICITEPRLLRWERIETVLMAIA
jgi:hypothetical protein